MLLASAVFCMVGILLVFRMIPPNSNTGFRTGRTFSDEAVWYTVNANVGWALVLSFLSWSSGVFLPSALTSAQRA